MIMYTSGTTGHPKGAALTSRNFLTNAFNCLAGYKEPEAVSYLHACPMFHAADGPTSHRITMLGGKHVFPPGGKFSPEGVLKTIQDQKVQSTVLVPTMVNMCLSRPDVKQYDLSSLKYLVYGGSPMPQKIIEMSSQYLPDAVIIQSYGMTETAPMITIFPAHRYPPRTGYKLLSCGRPCVAVSVKIINGEICTKGPHVMQGYWNNAEATNAAIDEDGWMHTGDVGYLDEDGFLFIKDRKKDMVISGGENVYSSEVENIIYLHASVQECAVFGTPHELWGEQVTAAVFLKSPVTAEELTEHCKAHLGGYQVPKKWVFSETALPKGGSGKILKRKLREPYWENKERAI